MFNVLIKIEKKKITNKIIISPRLNFNVILLFFFFSFSECSVAGFLSNSGLIERVPYVFLPQRGQIIYPHAEIRFEGIHLNPVYFFILYFIIIKNKKITSSSNNLIV